MLLIAVVTIAASSRVLGEIRSETMPSHSTAPAELPTDLAAERELLKALGPGWTVEQSPHVVVAHRRADAAARTIRDRAEHTYARVASFCKAMSLPMNRPHAKLQIVWCQTWPEYQRVVQQHTDAPATTCGMYLPDVNRTILCAVNAAPEVKRIRTEMASLRRQVGARRTAEDASVAQLEKALARLEAKLSEVIDRLDRMVVQHEIAHHVLHAVGIHRPDLDQPWWLIEGLATLFEVPLDGDWRQGLPPPNVERLRDWRRAKARGMLPSIDSVLSGPGTSPEIPLDQTISYAHAWAMVYYLCSRHADRFTAYVRALLARRPGRAVDGLEGREEFIRFFGPIDKTFTSQWENFVSHLPSSRGEEKR